ncbi:hypothetical protein NDK43_30230 [Neobacillus pocheonensis]|uniref:Signal transduction histidine kinase 5TM receptor LytS transmembrane region domain-containing protein n=1 Tax=Neobacillus pocheonensis TaxID=363869 RepID=A0ABT0WHH4_9BACI|nr:hypothetical protein [Neobacillus pocheonensis]
MFVQFGENVALIMLFLFLTIYFFNKPLNQLSLKQKILIGLLQGIFGIIVIFIGVKIENKAVLDFRQLAVILAAFYGGFPAAFITGIILGIYRLLFVNGINYVAIIGAASIVSLGICLGVISNRTHHYLLKWTLLLVFRY